jgi:DNA-binding response OmpR family regulator
MLDASSVDQGAVSHQPEIAPRVAWAEDDPAFRDLVADAIRADGYDVLALRNGTELLEYLAASQIYGLRYPEPSLVILDLMMPGFSGLELASGLRRARYSRPVILVTAFGTAETHREARRLGVTAVFDKPFDIDDLRTAVSLLAPISKAPPI